jgi:hypothetical protein
MSRRVLVTGDRNWSDRRYLEAVLTSLHGEDEISVVIEGEAPGADGMARDWAKANGIPFLPFPADWERYKRRGRKNPAGPIRNRRMYSEGRPDLVVAFHEDLWHKSKGTRDMVEVAMAGGTPVLIFPPQPDPATIEPQLELF